MPICNSSGPVRSSAGPAQLAKPFSFLSGRILTCLRAGLALNHVSSPVKGLMPLRALTAGRRNVVIFIRPGKVKLPMPRLAILASISRSREPSTRLTSPVETSLSADNKATSSALDNFAFTAFIFFGDCLAAFLSGISGSRCSGVFRSAPSSQNQACSTRKTRNLADQTPRDIPVDAPPL